MDEKDKQIERLFDDYASSLEPNVRLADRAKQKMQSKQKPKRTAAFWGGLVAACSAVLVIAFCMAAFMGKDDTGSDSGGSVGGGSSTDNAPTAPALQGYSISEVRAEKVDINFANQYINTQLDDAQIFSESYYACYIKDTNEFVYLKAVLGVSYGGGNIQMSVIAETSDMTNKELAQEYERLMNGYGYRYSTKYVNGEYVTAAYWAKADCKYYVSAMGNANGAQDLAAEIIGTKS